MPTPEIDDRYDDVSGRKIVRGQTNKKKLKTQNISESTVNSNTYDRFRFTLRFDF